ncbi:hypothetical protein BVX95_00575 [archaeon D22]|nr:hypothetical protein BVX95_00575 [archaeon D22]
MKVMAFGTFDLFHKGHEYYLTEAKKLGDELVVVVAKDKTVRELKGFFPSEDQRKRKANIEKLKFADKVVLGDDKNNWYKVIQDNSPDIIALGYDQSFFIESLKEKLDEFGLKTEVVRIRSFYPEKYKSSLFRKS